MDSDGPDVLANLEVLVIFMQIACWRIWRFWQFLCKLHGSNVLAILAIFMQITSPEMGLRHGRF